MKKTLTLILLLFHSAVFSQIITKTNLVTYTLPAKFQFKYLEFNDGTQIKVGYYDDKKEYFICGEKISPRIKLTSDQKILNKICDCSDKGLTMLGPTLSMKITTQEAESLIRNTDFRNITSDGNSIYLNTGDEKESLITGQNDELLAFASNYIKSYENYTEQRTEVASAADYSNISFNYSSSTLQSSSYPILDALVTTLRIDAKQVTITGYTSSDEKETAAENQKLALDRANAIKTYLVYKGVAASGIKTKGLGEANPIASNNTEEGRKMNRRVEVKIE